jgi:hypothetical protein
VLEQGPLDLAGADLVAAGLDQVGRLAPDDPNVPIRRPGREVPGPEPAIAHGLSCRLGPVEVPEEQIGSADHHLADRLGVRRCVLAVVADDANIDARERGTDLARTPFTVGSDRRVHQRFGQPVTLDDPLTGGAFDSFEGLRRKRG